MEAALTTIVGLALGSFCGVLAARLQTGASLMARSTCDGCRAPLPALSLIPVVSYAAQRGRCQCGAARLSWRYPAFELLVAAACLAAWLASHSLPVTAILGVLAVLLVALSAIDLATMTLPDVLTAALACLSAAWIALLGLSWGDALAGAALAGGLGILSRAGLSLLLGRTALGFGDIKLMAACGLWTGVAGLPLFLVLSGVAGIVLGLAWRATGRGRLFPFGPALAAGCYLSLLATLEGFLS
jgi:leader peptidase (prepilin peptidase)/N-methyltransferase